MRFLLKTLIPIFYSVFTLTAYSGDSTTNTNPSLTSRSAVKGTACSNNYEEAFSSTGTPLFCQGGYWRSAGQNGWQEVTDIFYRTAATNYTTVVRFVYCPAGKVIVGGDCNFNGWTNQNKTVLTGAHQDYTACFYALNNAYDASDPFGAANTIVSTAYCIDAP